MRNGILVPAMHSPRHSAPENLISLEDRLAEIGRRHSGCQPAAVAEIVKAVLATMRGDLSPGEASLLSEIEDLQEMIVTAKAEIVALSVDDITASHIPSATDELDAIVAHTAAATDIILEVCETLDDVATALGREPNEAGPDAAARLQDATTRIYEACSFQDITGQRITKIVATLKTIERKVVHIVAAFGGRSNASPPVAEPADPDDLLHGPQLPAVAMDQMDIDKLLASFD